MCEITKVKFRGTDDEELCEPTFKDLFNKIGEMLDSLQYQVEFGGKNE